VHALRYVHQLLVPGGTMVDVHPVTEARVETAGGSLGVIEEPEWVSVDLPNAEARLRDAIRDGFYALEDETAFDVLQHFDHADELLELKAEHLWAQPALVRRIRTAAPPLATRERVVLRRLRALPATTG